MNKLFLREMILLGLMILAIGHGHAADNAQSVVHISVVEGDVAYRLSPRDNWKPAEVGMALKVLGQVATGPDSRAEIEHRNGVVRIVSARDTVTVYEIMVDARPLQPEVWSTGVWRRVCRVLDQNRDVLDKVDVVTNLRGEYRVDWASYALAALYWKDDNQNDQAPTLFHIQSAILALENLLNDPPQELDKAELTYLMAECERMAGNDEQARKHFRDIIRTYPDSPWSEKAKQQL